MGVISLDSKLDKFDDDMIVEFLMEILDSVNNEIISLNKKQLEKGQKADGSFLREYSQRTIKQRELEGNPVKGDKIALFDTGDFWKGIWAKAYDGKLSIFSKDSKTELLVSEYGESIFGLTEENFNKLGEIVIPKLRMKVVKYLKS